MPLDVSWVNPSVPLVPLADAKVFLQVTDTDHDTEIAAFVDAAQEAVCALMGADSDGTWTDQTAPRAVVHAIKLLLGHYYEHRGDDLATTDDAVWRAIINLLGRHRTPVVG
jgi:hypothetical protein